MLKKFGHWSWDYPERSGALVGLFLLCALWGNALFWIWVLT